MAAALAVWVAVPRDRPAPPAQAAAEAERTTPAVVSPGNETVKRAAPSAAPMPPAAIPDRQDGTASSEPPPSRQQGRVAVDPLAPDKSRNAQRFDAGSAAGRERTERSAAAGTDQAIDPDSRSQRPSPRIGPIGPAETAEAAAKMEASASSVRGGRQPADQQSATLPAAPPAVAAPDAGAGGAGVTIAGARPTPPPQLFDRAGADATRLPLEVESPDARHRWRVNPAGQVEHSSSAGATWQSASLPASDVLTAGMSPGGSVCWLVGRNGGAWLTIDGVRFERRPLPEPVDLISVRATDASHAIAAAVDGRRFVTADGGVTWGH
jgi:hypothetical protein